MQFQTLGPGDSGTITALELNGVAAGSTNALTSSLDGNGTYSNLIITNNVDYNEVDSNVAAGFWSVFTADYSRFFYSSRLERSTDHRLCGKSDSQRLQTGTMIHRSSPGTPQFTSTVTFTADCNTNIRHIVQQFLIIHSATAWDYRDYSC